jgi:pyridinium-3,5-bisthiocarboxylic acid mononucleotide nickel chelatase
MKALIFDPFAGVSGDMTVAALIDLGLPVDWLQQFIAQLGLGDVRLVHERVNRRGISCAHIRFELPEQKAHRHLRHIVEIIDRANMPEIVRQRSRDAFQRLAVAEAAVHGTTIEKVHFHEVGALDAILDVVCAMAGVHELGFERFFTRPIALGSGWIQIEHGNFPVPAPATLRLLDGLPVSDAALAGECTTPTGAAIVATLTNGALPPARLRMGKSGFGAGTRDPEDRPNCLRLISAEIEASDEMLYIVQTDVDDLSPELVPAALDACLAAGALDATTQAVGMKKGRPAVRFEALVPPALLDAVLAALFRTTTTIGARYWPVERPSLVRREEIVDFRGHPIRLKTVELPGGGTRAKPDHDDVARAAQALGITHLEAVQALLNRRDG